ALRTADLDLLAGVRPVAQDLHPLSALSAGLRSHARRPSISNAPPDAPPGGAPPFPIPERMPPVVLGPAAPEGRRRDRRCDAGVPRIAAEGCSRRDPSAPRPLEGSPTAPWRRACRWSGSDARAARAREEAPPPTAG